MFNIRSHKYCSSWHFTEKKYKSHSEIENMRLDNLLLSDLLSIHMEKGIKVYWLILFMYLICGNYQGKMCKKVRKQGQALGMLAPVSSFLKGRKLYYIFFYLPTVLFSYWFRYVMDFYKSSTSHFLTLEKKYWVFSPLCQY